MLLSVSYSLHPCVFPHGANNGHHYSSVVVTKIIIYSVFWGSGFPVASLRFGCEASWLWLLVIGWDGISIMIKITV